MMDHEVGVSVMQASERLSEMVGSGHDRNKQIFVSTLMISLISILYYWNKFSYWSRRKIKGPRPIPILGNFYSYLFNTREKLDPLWVKTYGPIFGLYFGTRPILVIADVDVVKELCIKNSDLFRNRYFVGVKNKYQKNVMVFLEDRKHKRVRSVFTPTFKSSKIKTMYKLLNEYSIELEGQIRDEIANVGDGAIKTKEIFGAFSIATAVGCFFGIRLNKEDPRKAGNHWDNTRENFARKVDQAFSPRPLRLLVSSVLPLAFLKKINFVGTPTEPFEFFATKAKAVVEQRRKQPTLNNDYLNVLLNAKVEDGSDPSKIDDIEAHYASINEDNRQTNGKLPKLTEDEIYCNIMVLMLLSTSTTSQLISTIVFVLSQEMRIQTHLNQELLKVVHIDEKGSLKFDYDDIISCTYLDCVISETLRCYGPIVFADRIAGDDYYLAKHDLTIEKGTIVQIAYHAIHHDLRYWSDPYTFNPDRFLPENKANIVPGSYCPFGVGPRSCPSYRFSLAQTKLCLANILTKFVMLPAPGTQYPPKMKSRFFLTEISNLSVRMRVR